MTNKTYNGRKVHVELIFDKNSDKTFGNYYAAIKWLQENQYSYGSMSGNSPIALWAGHCSISKWHNLSQEEKQTCDGVLIGEFRNGVSTILIF